MISTHINEDSKARGWNSRPELEDDPCDCLGGYPATDIHVFILGRKIEFDPSGYVALRDIATQILNIAPEAISQYFDPANAYYLGDGISIQGTHISPTCMRIHIDSVKILLDRIEEVSAPSLPIAVNL